MRDRLNKNGFTLVEILVAVSLIATILAMVYGSYFAAARSARACEINMAMSQEGQKALEQMARQIRCSYAGEAVEDSNSVRSDPGQRTTVSPESVSYFSGDADAPDGRVLHMVTTNARFEEKGPAGGLFEVDYRLDRRTGIFSVSQRRYIGVDLEREQENWQATAENVEELELEFSNGEKWLRSWKFREEKKLPNAVRIEIGCRGEDGRQYRHETVAYVSCRQDRKLIQSEASTPTNRR